MPTITRQLQAWAEGDAEGLRELIPLVYGQLRQMAGRHLRNESNFTISPTELVHEAFLRLSQYQKQFFRDRVHFYGASAEIMRRVLVDLARRRNTAKRGATLIRVELSDIARDSVEIDFLALNDAVNKLGALDPRQAQIVNLRFFGGLSIEQTAYALDISEATVRRDWVAAKAWLLREMSRTSR